MTRFVLQYDLVSIFLPEVSISILLFVCLSVRLAPPCIYSIEEETSNKRGNKKLQRFCAKTMLSDVNGILDNINRMQGHIVSLVTFG